MATVFQRAAFATVWFRSYQASWEPFLAVHLGADVSPRGLLAMAVARDGTQVVPAGDHQAEYHAWLASSDDTSFGAEALCALQQALPGRRVVFRYLPPGIPLAGIVEGPELVGRADVAPHPRPLLRLDAAAIERSLGKKGNKSRLNRLARVGELRFERLTSRDALAAAFGTIIDQYDFRQGAVTGAATTPRATLGDLLNRLESGGHVYSRFPGPPAVTWLLPTPATIGVSNTPFAAPEPRALIYDATQRDTDEATFEAELRQVLADASPDATCLYVAIAGHATARAHRLTAHGFTPYDTIGSRRPRRPRPRTLPRGEEGP